MAAAMRPRGWPHLGVESKTGSYCSWWQDLQDAWPPILRLGKSERAPVAGLRGGLLLPLGALVAALAVYFAAPRLRVENGSEDSCDPIRTYGEITHRGMRALLAAVIPPAANNSEEVIGTKMFLDIGSGNGEFVKWACMPARKPDGGGGFSKCVGVELHRGRHERAIASMTSDAADGNVTAATGGFGSQTTFIQGDILDNLDLLENKHLHLVYWNNLCFPSEQNQAVALRFARAAPANAKLVTLAELPVSVPAHGLHLQRPKVHLEMSWGAPNPAKQVDISEEIGAEIAEHSVDAWGGYRPFEYTRPHF